MKKLLLAFIMMAILMPIMASCSKSDDEEPRLYATEADIQGRWGYVGQYSSYVITFNKPDYTIYMKAGKDSELESGTYKMDAKGIVTLKPTNGKESSWTQLEVYWDDSNKSALHIWPIGSFTRLK